MNTLKKALAAERFYLILCIVLGAVQAWICRYSMIADGVSYLDIGDAYFRRDWAAAINAYWSPMYSWCLGLALYLLRPSIWWEFITAHFVNLVIYIGTLFCFRFFLHAVLRTVQQETAGSAELFPFPEWAFLGMAYSIFLVSSLVLIDVGWVTPDLLAAGMVFLIAGYLIELRNHHSYPKYALFGALNALAYFAKGINFVLAFGFFAILLLEGKRSKSRVCGVLLSVATFLLVCSPFIYALSKAEGKLTFGDTGKLVYSALVYPNKPQIHWQGDPPGSGVPLHPTRKLMDNPSVFEFARPIRGTYPPWDDPAYWNDGTRWNFRLRSQLRVLVQSALAYSHLLLEESALLAGVLIFLFIGGKPTQAAILSNWPLLACAGLGLVAYSFVLVIPRYIGASIVLFWVAVLAGVRLPENETSRRLSEYVAGAVAIALLLLVLGHVADITYANLTVGDEASARDQVQAAVDLRSMGLQSGDKVAIVGYGMNNHWARLARFRIVSEVAPGPLELQAFWTLPQQRRNAAYECLSRTGAVAAVAWDPPPIAKENTPWKRIGETNYYAYFFRR